MFTWHQNIMILWHRQNIKVKVFASIVSGVSFGQLEGTIWVE